MYRNFVTTVETNLFTCKGTGKSPPVLLVTYTCHLRVFTLSTNLIHSSNWFSKTGRGVNSTVGVYYNIMGSLLVLTVVIYVGDCGRRSLLQF